MRKTDIFDFFSRRKGIRRATLVVLMGILAWLVSSLHFSEDISDFLPLGTREREQMSVYQNISGADKMILLFSGPEDPDYTVEAIGCFADKAEEKECPPITAQIDMDAITAVCTRTSRISLRRAISSGWTACWPFQDIRKGRWRATARPCCFLHRW